jgi:hypothetical protein
MSKIQIEYGLPIVFTKDGDFPEHAHVVKPGSIVVLPRDAVLVFPTETINVVDIPAPKEQQEGVNDV